MIGNLSLGPSLLPRAASELACLPSSKSGLHGSSFAALERRHLQRSRLQTMTCQRSHGVQSLALESESHNVDAMVLCKLVECKHPSKAYKALRGLALMSMSGTESSGPV